MRYKVGDRVRIRTWQDLEYSYGGCATGGELQAPMQKNCLWTYHFNNDKEKDINEKCPDRILTIKNVHESYVKNYYEMIEIKGPWQEYMIKCLIKNYKEPIPIYNRFEILDL